MVRHSELFWEVYTCKPLSEKCRDLLNVYVFSVVFTAFRGDCRLVQKLLGDGQVGT